MAAGERHGVKLSTLLGGSVLPIVWSRSPAGHHRGGAGLAVEQLGFMPSPRAVAPAWQAVPIEVVCPRVCKHPALLRGDVVCLGQSGPKPQTWSRGCRKTAGLEKLWLPLNEQPLVF